jgi:outer membrane protein assembly factor BamB
MSRTRRSVLASIGLAGTTAAAGCIEADAPTQTPIERNTETSGGSQTRPSGVAQFRGSLERWGYYPEATVPDAVEQDWRLADLNTTAYSAAKASPVALPEQGVVFSGDTGTLHAVEPDGEVRWEASTYTEAPGVHGTPAVANGTVYVGAYDGALYAFDADSGDQQWRTDLGGSIGSSPLYYDGILYVAVEYADPEGEMVTVDARTGTVEWREPKHRPTDHPHSTPALSVADGRLVCGSNDGYLYCWSYPDLEFQWRFATSPPSEGEIKGPIAIYDGAAFFCSWDHNAYRVDLETGTEDWAFETGNLSMTGPGIDPRLDTVFVGSHDQHLYAIDATTGEEHWRFETDGWLTGCPTICADRLLVGAKDDRLYAVEKTTGERVWHVDSDGVVTSTPRVIDEAIYYAERAPAPESGDTDGGGYKLLAQ